MVDRAALEMRSTRKGTGGSNPSLSAISAYFKRIFLNFEVRRLMRVLRDDHVHLRLVPIILNRAS